MVLQVCYDSLYDYADYKTCYRLSAVCDPGDIFSYIAAVCSIVVARMLYQYVMIYPTHAAGLPSSVPVPAPVPSSASVASPPCAAPDTLAAPTAHAKRAAQPAHIIPPAHNTPPAAPPPPEPANAIATNVTANATVNVTAPCASADRTSAAHSRAAHVLHDPCMTELSDGSFDFWEDCPFNPCDIKQHDVTATRHISTNNDPRILYHNTHGRPIFVCVSAHLVSADTNTNTNTNTHTNTNIVLRVYSDKSADPPTAILYPGCTAAPNTPNTPTRVCATFYVVAGNYYSVVADIEKKDAHSLVIDAWYEIY